MSQFIEMLEKNKSVDTLANVTTYVGKGIAPQYVEYSSINVINQACVYWDGVHWDNVKYHNESVQSKKSFLEDKDVLINSTGNGTLGRSCLFENQNDGKLFISDSHVAVIKTNKDMILPEVLVMYFSLNDTQAEIYRQHVTGSTNQVDIVFTSFKKMSIPTPNIEEQKKFVMVKQQADKSKSVIQKALVHLNGIQNSELRKIA